MTKTSVGAIVDVAERPQSTEAAVHCSQLLNHSLELVVKSRRAWTDGVGCVCSPQPRQDHKVAGLQWQPACLCCTKAGDAKRAGEIEMTVL